MESYELQSCSKFKELWPRIDKGAICKRCFSNDKFSIDNDMVRDHSMIPENIKIALEELTMVEEMLLSPVLVVMAIVRLRTGHVKSKGHVANFRQENLTLLKKIPRLPDTIPVLLIRRDGNNAEPSYCRVNRARVELVGEWLKNQKIYHHEFWKRIPSPRASPRIEMNRRLGAWQRTYDAYRFSIVKIIYCYKKLWSKYDFSVYSQ